MPWKKEEEEKEERRKRKRNEWELRGKSRGGLGPNYAEMSIRIRRQKIIRDS